MLQSCRRIRDLFYWRVTDHWGKHPSVASMQNQRCYSLRVAKLLRHVFSHASPSPCLSPHTSLMTCFTPVLQNFAVWILEKKTARLTGHTQKPHFTVTMSLLTALLLKHTPPGGGSVCVCVSPHRDSPDRRQNVLQTKDPYRLSTHRSQAWLD